MDNKLIKTTIDNHVALVMLDNQPVNAQSREFVEELISVFDELNETPTVRVIVLASRATPTATCAAPARSGSRSWSRTSR
jgi:enoyl-CoA hydratase